MDKRRIFGVLALAVITAVTAGVASPQMAAQRQETAEYQAPLEAAPVAQVEGETLSPNGRFQVRGQLAGFLIVYRRLKFFALQVED